MSVDTVDPASHVLVLGGFQVQGFAEGSYIEVVQDEDDWAPAQGAGGEVARVRIRNPHLRVTVTLMQTSKSVDQLSAMAALDAQTGIPPGNFLLKDLLGTTKVSSPDSYILKKTPDAVFAKDFQTRAFIIIMPKAKAFIGGSLRQL